jgi:microcystin-dependent protein
MMAFNFAPKGWALCNGQLLPINQNQALFSLLGTTFGGDGRTTFGLPDLRGRVPIHMGSSFALGQLGGQEFHTVNISEMPAHPHFGQGTSAVGNQAAAGGNILANTAALIYDAPNALTTLQPGTISNVGESQPHENRQPYLVVNFCIALVGVFPSQN